MTELMSSKYYLELYIIEVKKVKKEKVLVESIGTKNVKVLKILVEQLNVCVCVFRMILKPTQK